MIILLSNCTAYFVETLSLTNLTTLDLYGYYGTVGSGRLGSSHLPTVSCKLRAENGQELIKYFLCNSDRNPVVRNLPELAGIGENCAGIEKSSIGTDSDFNGSSRWNDRPGVPLDHHRNKDDGIRDCLSYVLEQVVELVNVTDVTMIDRATDHSGTDKTDECSLLHTLL
ncbi:unnamed protein product [Adineta ricciae]|uniref:Uncharacterized protein n=1 Tax=Adineta ricciae TaxID=249248 RepID=A0A815QVZ7_ADIRI|nr:unnamed protein product [Adineta ricciae]CAF1664999.1 unnamed protein product [Adineta ricciae]